MKETVEKKHGIKPAVILQTAGLIWKLCHLNKIEALVVGAR